LFANAYDQVRRAITFLNWKEDDLDELAPSLYAGRNNSNIRKKDSQPSPQPGASGAAPSTGTQPAGASGASPITQPTIPVMVPATGAPVTPTKSAAAPKDPFIQ
jgi:hypothetical protein